MHPAPPVEDEDEDGEVGEDEGENGEDGGDPFLDPLLLGRPLPLFSPSMLHILLDFSLSLPCEIISMRGH